MKEINLKSILYNFLNIAIIIITISLASSIFGSNNTLIWVAVEVAVLMFSKMTIGIECKQATLVVFLLFSLIGVSNRLAMLNPYAGLLINFITIFAIMYIPSRRVRESAYMPFMLCYIFGDSMKTTAENFSSRVISLVAGSLIVSLVYYVYNRKKEEKKITLKKFDLTSDRFILSLKMAIGVSLSMFVGATFGLQKTLWIALSTMSITQIDFEYTKKKFKHRITSTIIGSFVFVLLFKL